MSDEVSYLTEEYVTRLQGLSDAIESGKESEVNALIGELTTLRESSLYQELGMLTREIHDTIRNFGNDDRIASLANEEIPDARERLNYIVTKTDEAAHRTMNDAEETIDLMDGIAGKVNDFHHRWKKFRNRELSRQEFVELNDNLDGFFESFSTESQAIKSKMTDIMLAQDYQDITGQMIKQVVTMVQVIEEKLVRLVAISGNTKSKVVKKQESGDKTFGPQLPTANREEVATDQGDVDDLLASLGF